MSAADTRAPSVAIPDEGRPRALVFPFEPPEPGATVEVAPGILWTRLPLPYEPGHVNAYLIEDDGGWVAVDVGLDDAPTRSAWERLLAGPLGGRPLTRVLVTHWHSDHMGLAGWLCERFGAELVMSESEYLHGLVRKFTPQPVKDDIQRSFFLRHGLSPAVVAEWVRTGHRHLDLLHAVPTTYRRVVDGDTMRIGGRAFEIMTAGGHSPESVMLLCRPDGLFLAADQVLARTFTNIAVQAFEPKGDPIGIYLRSLERLTRELPAEILSLPGHDLVHRGVPERIADIRRHIAARSARVAEACRGAPRTVAELLPFLFRRPPSPVWIGFVASDVLAILHNLAHRSVVEKVSRGETIAFVTRL